MIEESSSLITLLSNLFPPKYRIWWGIFIILLIVIGIVFFIYYYYKKDLKVLDKSNFIANIVIDKNFDKTSLEIINSECTVIKNNNKKFSCTNLEPATYDFIFKGDNETYTDKFEKEQNNNSPNLQIIKEIVMNRIQFNFDSKQNEYNEKNLDGMLVFNTLKKDSSEIFKINNNDVRLVKKNDKDSNVIYFSMKEWLSVIKPLKGLFLNIQIGNEFINDLPKFHYFDKYAFEESERNNIEIFNNYKEKFKIIKPSKITLLNTNKDSLDNFFIRFNIEDLRSDNVLTFGQDNKVFVKIANSYYIDFNNSKPNTKYICNESIKYSTLEKINECYMLGKINNLKSQNNLMNFTVTFERKEDKNTKNKYKCDINIVQTNNQSAFNFKENFDCSKEFKSIFFISVERLIKEQKITISNLITGKDLEKDNPKIIRNIKEKSIK